REQVRVDAVLGVKGRHVVVDRDGDPAARGAREQREQLVAIEVVGGGERGEAVPEDPASGDRVGDVEREVAVQDRRGRAVGGGGPKLGISRWSGASLASR